MSPQKPLPYFVSQQSQKTAPDETWCDSATSLNHKQDLFEIQDKHKEAFLQDKFWRPAYGTSFAKI